MAGAGGGVDTGLDLDLFPAIRRQAAVGQWSPEERGPLLQTADGRTAIHDVTRHSRELEPD